MARTLETIDGVVANIENALEQLVKEKPMDAIQKINEKLSDYEKVLYDMRNVQIPAMTKALDDKLGPIVTEQPQIKMYMENFKQEMSKINATIEHMELHAISTDYLNQSIAKERETTHNQMKQLHDSATQAVSAQFASLPSSSGTPSGSPGRGRDPLAPHRIYNDMDKLSGDEEYHVGTDWFKELTNLTEIAMPGSSRIINHVLAHPGPITTEILSSMHDPSLANNLSREMHGLLYRKTRGKARAHVENVEVHLGLEGLRAIKNTLFRTDGKKLKSQFDRLTELEVVKDTDMRNIATLITTWEAELARFCRIDPEYSLGKHQKRQILYPGAA